jgi:uncharacterized membrane protein
VTERPPDGDQQPEEFLGEPRWPLMLALLGFIALTIGLRIMVPSRPAVGADWLVPTVEIGLLIALLAADQRSTQLRAVWLRRVAVALILALAVAGIWSTVVLIDALITGGPITNSASSLLASGALVWVGNNLIFGLIYWSFDGGGPRARAIGRDPYPDFAFAQHMSPELAPPGWRPQYVDYFYLGLTNGTAFSPTDTMPMAPWAKLTMGVQAMVSLLVVGLVIARAVNVFT